jgi:hypothetical protein
MYTTIGLESIIYNVPIYRKGRSNPIEIEKSLASISRKKMHIPKKQEETILCLIVRTSHIKT